MANKRYIIIIIIIIIIIGITITIFIVLIIAIIIENFSSIHISLEFIVHFTLKMAEATAETCL